MMNIIVIGVSHKCAPIDIRERVAFDNINAEKALGQLKRRFPDTEFVVLSTCNRVELYSVGPTSVGLMNNHGEKIIRFLSEFHNLAVENFSKFLYVHQGIDAVRHLLKVASSLDSMVVGESQIISQVKKSYSLACSTKTTGKVLNRLFHCAFAAAKKVHTATSISNGRISVAGVAVELATQLFAEVSKAKVVVIGAGQMGELLVQHLLHIGCENIVIVNRSYQNAVKMAGRYGLRCAKWEELGEQLLDANIVIASATVKDYIFRKDSFSRLIQNRRAGTMLVVDIAVPRNFEPGVNELEDVYLYSIDDLSDVVEQNRKIRENDITEGMGIIEESVSDFMNWFHARDIGPLIGRMKNEFTQISQKELNSFFVGVRGNASCRQSAELMVKRVVNRLLHCVIKNVDVVAKKQGPTEAARLIDNIIQNAEEISSAMDNDKQEVEEAL